MTPPIFRISIGLLVAIFTACSSVGGISPEARVQPLPSNGPIGRTFAAEQSKFTACARDSVTVQTGIIQHLQLTFTVTPEGTVEKPKIESMSSPDPDLQGCVLKKLRAMRFPAPLDGKSKPVKYPLVLESA